MGARPGRGHSCAKVVAQVVTSKKGAGMAEIGVKELKATASAVIEQVEAGAAYVVTKRGRPAAVLLPWRKRRTSSWPTRASTCGCAVRAAPPTRKGER